MKDYMSSAAALYDGGWREGDNEELIFEYGLSEDEAAEICTRLAEIEQEIEQSKTE